jgi:copper chaperone NosL
MPKRYDQKSKRNEMSSASATKFILAAVAVLLVAIALFRLNRVSLPEGPVPVVWDREVCEHCKMHVGDPRFAAQLQATDGTVVSFDDPGCLAAYLESHPTEVHAIYFRDREGQKWLSQSEAAFILVDDSPMGYGIAAVARETPGARDWGWAREHALQRKGAQ